MENGALIQFLTFACCDALKCYYLYQNLAPTRICKLLISVFLLADVTDLLMVALNPNHSNFSFFIVLCMGYVLYCFGFKESFFRVIAAKFFLDLPYECLIIVVNAVHALLGLKSWHTMRGFGDFLRILVCVLCFVSILVITAKWFTKKQFWRKFPAFLGAILLAFDGIGAIILLPLPLDNLNMSDIVASASIGIFYCIILAAPVVALLMFERHQMLLRNQMLDYQRTLQFNYYAGLSDNLREFQHLRHDLNNYLRVHQNLSGEAQEAMTLALRERLEKSKAVELCSNPYINAVLYEKSALFEAKQATLTVQVLFPDECHLDSLTLVCIAANLLDNALEACQEGDEVCFSAISRAKLLVIRVSNPFYAGTKLPTQMHTSFTTKKGKGHGHGLENVRQATKKAGGSFTLKKENELVVATAILCDA